MYVGYTCKFFAVLWKGSAPVELGPCGLWGTSVVNKTLFRFLAWELEGMNCGGVASQDQIIWDVFHMHLILKAIIIE